jgi:hypothetical protein
MSLPGSRTRGLRIGPRRFWLVVSVVALVGLVKLYGPIALARRQQDELARLRLEKANLLGEQRRLERYKWQLASDAGLEAAARREGYVREGERRLVFVRKADRAPSPGPAEDGPKNRRGR